MKKLLKEKARPRLNKLKPVLKKILPETVIIALFVRDDDECECAVCEGDDEKGTCKTPPVYLPGIVHDLGRLKEGTVVGTYQIKARKKIEVVLVDVDTKGNKTRR